MTREVTIFSQAHGCADGSAQNWPRAAVFDCDGLLVNTASCWRAAYRSAAEHAGATLDGFDLGALDGASTHGAAAELSRALATTISAESIADGLQRALRTRAVVAMPGAMRLLAALTTTRLPVAVASNAPAEAIHVALHRAALDAYIHTQLSAETAGNFKPHPDVYRRACRELGVHPSDAIAFEDSAPGAQSARAAGLTVIVVPSGPAARQHADLVVPRLDDPRVFELLGVRPPAASVRSSRRG
jgi:HAD superfamily hydrolase (TIGR01509 family)